MHSLSPGECAGGRHKSLPTLTRTQTVMEFPAMPSAEIAVRRMPCVTNLKNSSLASSASNSEAASAEASVDAWKGKDRDFLFYRGKEGYRSRGPSVVLCLSDAQGGRVLMGGIIPGYCSRRPRPRSPSSTYVCIRYFVCLTVYTLPNTYQGMQLLDYRVSHIGKGFSHLKCLSN